MRFEHQPTAAERAAHHERLVRALPVSEWLPALVAQIDALLQVAPGAVEVNRFTKLKRKLKKWEAGNE